MELSDLKPYFPEGQQHEDFFIIPHKEYDIVVAQHSYNRPQVNVRSKYPEEIQGIASPYHYKLKRYRKQIDKIDPEWLAKDIKKLYSRITPVVLERIRSTNKSNAKIVSIVRYCRYVFGDLIENIRYEYIKNLSVTVLKLDDNNKLEIFIKDYKTVSKARLTLKLDREHLPELIPFDPDYAYYLNGLLTAEKNFNQNVFALDQIWENLKQEKLIKILMAKYI